MKKKILFVINTLGGAGAEMALLELLEKLIKENEKTKDVQYEIFLYVLMGQGELIKRLPINPISRCRFYRKREDILCTERSLRLCLCGEQYFACYHIFYHRLQI